MTAPVAAPAITARNNGVGVARIVIPAVSDATSYKLYRDTHATATTLLAGGLAAGINFDKTLTPGTRYWYRVKATNASGDSGFGAEVSVIAMPADESVTPTAALKIVRKL